MDPLAVDLTLLLRTLESEVRLAPGRVLMARVVDNGDPAHAKLSIAGKLLEARLPAHLQEGQEVRLTVREVSAEKVVLSLSTPPPLAQAPREGSHDAPKDPETSSSAREHDDPTAQTVQLRYQAPTIGAVDVRLTMREGSLQALLAVPAGEAHGLASEQAGELRERLSIVTGLPVDLVVQARRDPVDLYA